MAVDWNDPAVVKYIFFLYQQNAVFLLGFHGMHIVTQLRIERELLLRKRPFRLVYVPFLLARYLVLSTLLFFVISQNTTVHVDCDGAYRFFAAVGSICAMFASWILCTRPLVIFHALSMRLPIVVLSFLGFVQAVLVVLQGVLTVRSQWNAARQACDIVQWDSKMLATFYSYSFGYDVVIVSSTLYAVHKVQHLQERRKWHVGDALCVQGIWYIITTCAVNVPVAVLAILDLNIGMDILLSTPAMVISVVASAHAMLSLDEYERANSPSTAGMYITTLPLSTMPIDTAISLGETEKTDTQRSAATTASTASADQAHASGLHSSNPG
ncbi:uncharacterized protein BXZ73DRAFT_101781 [Epithele typhae]|uniref:uncharacterized protein n=1 Tax=Epithele typhae TaxID=378194 RepID=UPI0020074460|nr:uncharacterized protein BXZ73DRAFT_101781 [Epithele typhae]KAH9930405.1 hypothetical protein BXZ73DRAFT_101781 [Epithele typhae]